MPQLVEVEISYARVMNLLRMVGSKFSEDDARQVREHYDLYQVFHYAAMADLAHGDKGSFARNIDRASGEVAALEKLLARLLAS